MRSAVEIRCGPSASTSSLSEIIELGAVDVEDLRAVEHGEADRVGGALAQLFQVGLSVLAQAGRVERRHAEVGDAQAEAVLARGALLEVAEREQRDHVAVRRGAAHPELVGDVGDAEHRALGREAAEDRQTTLERLRVTRFAQARDRPRRLKRGGGGFRGFGACSGHVGVIPILWWRWRGPRCRTTLLTFMIRPSMPGFANELS